MLHLRSGYRQVTRRLLSNAALLKSSYAPLLDFCDISTPVTEVLLDEHAEEGGKPSEFAATFIPSFVSLYGSSPSYTAVTSSLYSPLLSPSPSPSTPKLIVYDDNFQELNPIPGAFMEGRSLAGVGGKIAIIWRRGEDEVGLEMGNYLPDKDEGEMTRKQRIWVRLNKEERREERIHCSAITKSLLLVASLIAGHV